MVWKDEKGYYLKVIIIFLVKGKEELYLIIKNKIKIRIIFRVG